MNLPWKVPAAAARALLAARTRSISAITISAITVSTLSISSPALAQHETGADLFSGEQVYQNLCANCHGIDGALVPNVDLGHGVFRQNYTDEQLIGIIQKGIPNTPMPPNPTMSTEQAQLVVDYLRSRAVDSSATLTGNVESGKTLYLERGFCNYCHMIDGEGEVTGPDLSRIGEVRSAAELVQSLREPNARIEPNQRQYAVTTKDGTSYQGRLLNQDIFSVQILDSSGKLRSFDKEDLTEHGFAPSPMGALASPEEGGDWTDQEVADLVAYLASLRAPATGATP